MNDFQLIWEVTCCCFQVTAVKLECVHRHGFYKSLYLWSLPEACEKQLSASAALQQIRSIKIVGVFQLF